MINDIVGDCLPRHLNIHHGGVTKCSKSYNLVCKVASARTALRCAVPRDVILPDKKSSPPSQYDFLHCFACLLI